MTDRFTITEGTYGVFRFVVSDSELGDQDVAAFNTAEQAMTWILRQEAAAFAASKS